MPADRPRLIMCEATDAFGHVEAEPIVVSVDEAGWCRLEFEDGSVYRCPWVELAGEKAA